MRIFTVLILVSFLFCAQLHSQTFSFYRTSPEIIYTNDTFGVISHAKINNLTGSNNQIRIIRTVVNVPPGWESCICDIVQCHPPGLDTAIANYPPGMSNIDVMLYAHSIPGRGYVTLRAEKVSNTNEHYTVVFGGEYNPLGISQISTTAEEFSLGQNYPNPFNPSTTINFSLPKGGYTSLRIIGVNGEEVGVLVNDTLPEGKYRASFDATGFASGAYFYRLSSAAGISVKKMVLVK